MKRKFTLGIITDEVSQNIFEAASFAAKHGLDCLEVRSVNDHSPFDFTDADIADIKAAAVQYGLKVTAISAPLYKCDLDDAAAIAQHQKNFEICAQRANQLGAKMIRGFDFWDIGASLETRAAMFDVISEICEKYDILCVLESDPSVHAATPQKLAELLARVESPRVRALFDPGNEVWVNGAACAEGYEILKPWLAHIHIKDAAVIEGKPDAVKVGTGVVDFESLFAKLLKDDYDGGVMLETHYRENVELTEEQLKRPGGSNFSAGALEASEESIEALKAIIKKVQEKV